MKEVREDCPCYSLRLDDVTYCYAGGVAAVNGVTLGVEPGEKVALLGVNGSGKSTLLKILGGLIVPSSGRYQALGEDVTTARLGQESFSHWLHRRIGFVFENSDAQLFCPTVREEIMFGPLQMGLEACEVERRLADVAGLMGVESLMDRSPYQLSAGQKKRVALACVLSIGPEVLLFDEPTNGLDPKSQHALVHLIGELNRAGKTIVTTTHDFSILPDIADRVLVLGGDHAVAFEGTPAALLADPELLLKLDLIHEHAYARMIDVGHIHHTSTAVRLAANGDQ